MNAPSLNKSIKFSENMRSAHELILMAKNGKKGNKLVEGYALPAFNVTTYDGIQAACEAFDILGSSGILAFSNSALKHFGHGDALQGLEAIHGLVKFRASKSSVQIATHLDHGDNIGEHGRKVIRGAIEMFTSVMADNSTDHANKRATSLKVNMEATREVVELAHPKGVSVEGELGVLAGVEDEDTHSEISTYTDPVELKEFLENTGVLLLAPTIGTMHGPNKGKPGDKVKLNVELAHECLKLANKINDEIIFVAHGASTLYPQVVDYAIENLSALGLKDEVNTWKNFVGTDWEQIKGLIGAGFCKINTDTENRQTYLAALIGALNKSGSKVDIRFYEKITYRALVDSYVQKLIMAGNYGVWHEPKINVNEFKFDLNL